MSQQPGARRFPIRLLIVFGGIGLLVLAFALVDLSPDLDHLDARVLSGPDKGNYQAIVERMGKKAAEQSGTVEPVTTSGSVDNLRRLAAATGDCDVQFALVQDGVPAPEGSSLELIARLRKSESVLIVGKDAGHIERFAQMAGMKVGIGPPGSGTDYVARTVLNGPELERLGLRLSNHSIGEQMELLRTGQLDLGVFVLDEDAELVRRAIVEHGLELVSLAHLDVIARKYPFLWHGRIGAGQFDPIAVIPGSDTWVLRVDTMVVGNGCASYAETIGLLMVLSEVVPGIVEHNRDAGGSEFFPLSKTSARYFENGGPDFADLHVPWLVDILPISSWLYFIMAISILFNIGTAVHKFRLWRVDANRDKADQIVRKVLGAELTPEEIRHLDALAGHGEAQRAELDRAIAMYDAMRIKCQTQANSMLVPMGQEGSYRFQEDQMEEMLTALRAYRSRLVGPPAPEQDTGGAAEGSSST